MTATALRADPPPPPRRSWVWRTTAPHTVGCDRDHGQSPGTLDESARRLTHDEFAVAQQLAREGHDVRSLATRPGQGRTADLQVCGNPLEVKSWLSPAERNGNVPGARSVVNKLLQAEGQAATVVLNGRGSGLSEAAARAGMAVYKGLAHVGRIAAVRVLGDGFDLGWTRGRAIQTERAPRVGLETRRDPGLIL
jgi:hypothetical protein